MFSPATAYASLIQSTDGGVKLNYVYLLQIKDERIKNMLLPSRHVKYPTKVKDSLQKNLIPFHIKMSTSFKEELLLVADF